MGSQLGVVLVTVLFLIIYTKSKATYRRKHLIGGLFIVSKDEAMTIKASSLAAGRKGCCWSSSWEFTLYPQIWGGENKTEPGCFHETSKPTDNLLQRGHSSWFSRDSPSLGAKHLNVQIWEGGILSLTVMVELLGEGTAWLGKTIPGQASSLWLKIWFLSFPFLPSCLLFVAILPSYQGDSVTGAISQNNSAFLKLPLVIFYYRSRKGFRCLLKTPHMHIKKSKTCGTFVITT